MERTENTKVTKLGKQNQHKEVTCGISTGIKYKNAWKTEAWKSKPNMVDKTTFSPSAKEGQPNTWNF